MRTKNVKHAFLIRSLLVAMSFIYVFSPLHSELNILLHKISHNFVVENHHAVESVSEIHDHTIDSHSHKFLASTHSEETKHHHNTKKVDNHNHELISFFNSIFNSDASQNNKEKALFENKLDKHILSQIIDSPDLIPVYEKKNLWYHYSLPKSLKLEVIIPPPQGNPA